MARQEDRVDPALWQRPDMRTALASRDIATVFRLLQRVGVSQRRIAALTGQSQSEISEILSGRQVVSYDVLTRIADGLGVPRGHLGLAYDDATAELVGVSKQDPVTDEDEEHRRLLARLAELTVGTATVDPESWSRPFAVAWTSGPSHVGLSDIQRLEHITAQLRALDHEFGGGATRDGVLAQVSWAQQLLRAQVGEDASRSLHTVVADLHVLAGWTSFDIGILGPARRHFARALEHAQFVDEPSLVAKVLYCLGRVHMHHGGAAQALRHFQLGQLAAQQSGFGRAVAMLHANLAWAHSVIGDTRQAIDCIERARDEYTRVEQDEVPPWLKFFDSAELQAMRATALAFLAEPTPQQRAEAIERFTLSSALRELPLARARAFELTALAWLLIEAGDLAKGIQIGNDAVTIASRVQSMRVVDRFAVLLEALQPHLVNGDVRDLAQRIANLGTRRRDSTSRSPRS